VDERLVALLETKGDDEVAYLKVPISVRRLPSGVYADIAALRESLRGVEDYMRSTYRLPDLNAPIAFVTGTLLSGGGAPLFWKAVGQLAAYGFSEGLENLLQPDEAPSFIPILEEQ